MKAPPGQPFPVHRFDATEQGHKLTLAYRGTDFFGWQRQVERRTVQGCLEDVLATLWKRKIDLQGSGRTDTGVHALGQVASFNAPRLHEASVLQRALNANLPRDVRVVKCRLVSPAFHARFDAEEKSYRYLVFNQLVHDPFTVDSHWHVPLPLDLAAMRRAAAVLLGEHDFASFTSNPGYERIRGDHPHDAPGLDYSGWTCPRFPFHLKRISLPHGAEPRGWARQGGPGQDDACGLCPHPARVLALRSAAQRTRPRPLSHQRDLSTHALRAMSESMQASFPPPPPFHIVLVEPEIPPNTGAVARLCAATHCHLHLVEPLGFQLNDRTLARAGVDYWPQVTWQTWRNWSAFTFAHSEARCFFLTTKTKNSYTNARFQPGDCLVFGRETKGLPESLLEASADACLTIPIANEKVRSLNLATAVAIVLFEALRQVGPAP